MKVKENDLYSIGITGGIGSGKSEASSIISNMGYRIIDADKISHAMTEKPGPTVRLLEEAFGHEIVNGKGELKRQKLASIVFNDPRKNDLLKGILTSRVIDQMRKSKEEIAESGQGGLLFFDIPLLFETGCEFLCDEIWLIAADDDIRIERLIKRDGSSKDEIKKKFKSQMSQNEKMRLSDRVIVNNGTREELQAQLEELIKEYAE